MHNNNGAPTWRTKAILACLSVLCTYAFVEIVYRYKVSRKVAAGKYAITVISDNMSGPDYPGYFLPNKRLKYRMFDEDHNLLKENIVVTNNFGFISGNEYQIAKPEGEFRIVVVGDSLTACETNDFPWADVLERHLNSDEVLKKALKVSSFRVLNLGLSGSGFVDMACNYIRFGEQFCPDLLVVNYIEDDFLRDANANVKSRVHAAESKRQHDMDPAHDKNTRRNTIQVGDAEIIIHGGRPDQPPDLRDPTLTPSRLFIIRDDKVALDKERVGAIKAEIATSLLRHRLWYSLYPHALAHLLGREFTLDYNRFLASRLNPEDENVVAQAAELIEALEARHPKVLLLQNPLQGELVPWQAPDHTRRLREKLPDTRIVEMAEYLPIDEGAAEITSWYNLPFDGHWSNKGAEVYAAAINRAFRQLLPSFMDNSSGTQHAADNLTEAPRTSR